MLIYRKRNRADNEVSHGKKFTPMRETELVLKLKKEELFDPYILLPLMQSKLQYTKKLLKIKLYLFSSLQKLLS